MVQGEAKDEQESERTKLKVEFHEHVQTCAKPVDPYSTTNWLVNVTKNIWRRTGFMKIHTDIKEKGNFAEF